MGGQYTFKSLESKIVVTIGLVLTALLGFSAFVEIYYDTQVTNDVLFRQVDSLANTVQKSLIKDMSSGKSSDVQLILEAVGTERGITGIRIFDEDGLVLKSDDRTEVGHAVRDDVLASYHTGGRNFISDEGGYDVLHVVQPIANAPPCYGCHDRTKEINGVLSLDFSLESAQDAISRHQRLMLAVYVATIVLAGVLLYVMLKRMVNDPIAAMRSAMAVAEKGNLDVSIPVTSDDEIGSLQTSFNSMVARLKGLVEENLSQQREIVKNEKELELKEVLEEQNRALERANEEINDKNRYYMEMLSFISHELKSPLVVLKGYTGMLSAQDLGALNHQQMDAVVAMDKGVDALNDMIANYMDLSRLERGDLVPNKRRVELVGEVVRPVMYEFSKTLEKASMSMRVECPDTGISIMADPGLLKSVVYNLVSNAVKYGREGTDIVLSVLREGLDVNLSVHNEGEGIPQEDLDRVFERFSRLDGGKTQKGSGLGLYIVKLIIEMHGGSVSAESETGRWVRITCTLPTGTDEEEA